MDQKIKEGFIAVNEAAREDAVYLQLYEEYEVYNERLVALMRQLPQEQLDVVLDYIGVFGALHTRLMELALQQ